MLLYEQIMLNDDTETLNELYIGKTAGVFELEKACMELKKVVETDHASATKSPEMKKVCDIITKEFGFVSCEISLIPLGVAGAWTFHVNIDKEAIRAKTDLYIYNEKTGIRFNTKYKFKFSGSVTPQLINSLTAPELTAVLLHEIGHSFNQIKVLGTDNRTWLTKILNKIIGEKPADDVVAKDINTRLKSLNTYIISTIPKDFGKEFKIMEQLYKIIVIVGELKKIVNSKGAVYLTGGYFIAGQFMSAFWNRLRGKNTLGDGMHQGEYFADSFSAMYGYGKDLITGLAKLDKPVDILDKIHQVLTIPFIFVLSPTHPDLISRNINLIEQYQNTLDTDKTLSPEIAKELKVQLAEAKEQLEKLKTIYSFGETPKQYLSMCLLKALHTISGEKAIKSLMPKDYSFGLQDDNARVIKEK